MAFRCCQLHMFGLYKRSGPLSQVSISRPVVAYFLISKVVCLLSIYHDKKWQIRQRNKKTSGKKVVSFAVRPDDSTVLSACITVWNWYQHSDSARVLRPWIATETIPWLSCSGTRHLILISLLQPPSLHAAALSRQVDEAPGSNLSMMPF